MSIAALLRPDPLADLRRSFRELRESGKARHRDIAEQLGVSEGELIAAHCGEGGAMTVRRLRADGLALLQALRDCGELMALTRNAHCVHERSGRYASVEGGGAMGLVLGPDIDLRCFFSHWRHAFAVTELNARGVQHSLQVFDASGSAVHKVFTRAGTLMPAWAQAIEGLAHENQQAGIAVEAPAPKPAEKPDSEIDLAAFHSDWAGLHDTHHFFGLLKRHGLARTQALRLAEPRFAQRTEPLAVRELLQQAARDAVSLMVFVGNPGCIQIHTGPVQRVQLLGPWLNVLDPAFNLHLREDRIAESWLVRKPTVDGLVTSLELYDANGAQLAQFFGERKPGKPERADWRRLAESLVEGESAACGTC